MLQKVTPQIPSLTKDQFLRRYKNEYRREKMAPHYQAILEEAEKMSAPAAIYQEFALNRVSDLAAWSRPDTCAVTLAICTLGLRLESWAQELARDDLVSAVILEEVTLAWIVAITHELHGIIRQEGQERGLISGPGYRPGVGRWPLETQATVFDLLPADEIGVSLNANLVMTPKQSTSMIIPMRRQAADQVLEAS